MSLVLFIGVGLICTIIGISMIVQDTYGEAFISGFLSIANFYFAFNELNPPKPRNHARLFYSSTNAICPNNLLPSFHPPPL